MAGLLLSAHVLAGILLVGPITVAASVFPRYATAAGAADGNDAALAASAAMHRITRRYAPVSIAVPVLGLATAMVLAVLTQGWVLVSIGFTAVAGAVLASRVVPLQRALLSGPAAGERARLLRRLRGWTGVFALAWVVVVVLMILRPGSTTHV